MSQDLSPLFSEGIQEHFGLSNKLYPSKLPRIFRMGTMDGRYTDQQLWEMYGLPGQRNPGEGFKQGQFKPSFSKRYIPVNYGLGDVIAQEDWDDDQYGVIARVLPSKGGALARSHAVLRERVAADFIKNVCFAAEGNNTTGTSDGRPVFSTSHPISQANSAVVVSNRPGADVDFSVSSYQAGQTSLMQQFAPNNTEIIENKGTCLVINTDQRYIAKQVLKGEWYPNTADRDVNYNKDDNVDLVEWPYLRVNGATGTRNGWMLLGTEHYLRFIDRQEARIRTDWSINSYSYIFVSTCRFVVGASDWRGVFGSKGQ